MLVGGATIPSFGEERFLFHRSSCVLFFLFFGFFFCGGVILFVIIQMY